VILFKENQKKKNKEARILIKQILRNEIEKKIKKQCKKKTAIKRIRTKFDIKIK
jgi:hypothetical protein